MATLYFDGDKRRIYEVPTDSTYVVDGNGFRIYSGPGENISIHTGTELWSRYVDFRQQEEWAYEVYEKTGGAFRYSENGQDVYATFDIRLINSWLLVPADYDHTWVLRANLFPEVDGGDPFDTDRITAPGLSTQIERSDSLQILEASEGKSFCQGIEFSVEPENVPWVFPKSTDHFTNSEPDLGFIIENDPLESDIEIPWFYNTGDFSVEYK